MSKSVKHAPDNVYYNIVMVNPSKSNIPQIYAEYSVDNTTPILGKANDYYLTVERFSVPGTTIPIFIFEVQDGQANPNLGIYSVTLSVAGSDYQVFMLFQPQNTSVPVPGPPIPTQAYTQYYYVYDYQHMVDMINAALDVSFILLKLANPAIASTLPPFLIYEAEFQLLRLVYPKTYITDVLTINFNTPLAKFLKGFQTIIHGPAAVNGKNFEFVRKVLPANSNEYVNPIVPGATPYLFSQGEYNTLQYWNSFKNLVFLTGNLPIVAEYTPDQAIGGVISPGQGNFRPILTDFQPILSSAGDATSQLQYYPQGPYRLVDLISDQPLYKVDLRIQWQDAENRLFPLFIEQGLSASVKLAFIKKDSYAVKGTKV